MNSSLFVLITLFLLCSLDFTSAERILPDKPKKLQDWVSEQSTAHQAWMLKQPSSSPDAKNCASWRFAVETNTVRDWISVPFDCKEYVKNYMEGEQYRMDSEIVANQSMAYAGALNLTGDGKDVWVFDIDETLLSNLPYYQNHEFGEELFDEAAFDTWVDRAEAPALPASQRFYARLLELGFKVFLLTGRSEAQRIATHKNLIYSGFNVWEELILRGTDDQGKSAVVYKSERRLKIEQDGFRIRGNSGDQWSDLVGYSIGDRTFKLPNPMYYIA
eukprot:Gb_00531 [translate_table: standard]